MNSIAQGVPCRLQTPGRGGGAKTPAPNSVPLRRMVAAAWMDTRGERGPDDGSGSPVKVKGCSAFAAVKTRIGASRCWPAETIGSRYQARPAPNYFTGPHLRARRMGYSRLYRRLPNWPGWRVAVRALF